MSVKTVAVVLGVVLAGAVSACQPAADSASSSGSGSGTAAASAPAPAAVPTTAKPRTTPRAVAPKPVAPKATATPTATRTTAKPAPKPVAPSTCGAPANPWGYNFCARGSYIYSPAGGVCAYFDCIGNFGNGVGYMVQCNDGMYSMSGGRSGACSHHSGEGRAVYSGAGPH